VDEGFQDKLLMSLDHQKCARAHGMRNEQTRKKGLAEEEKKGLSWERTVSFSQKEVSVRMISNPGIEVQTTAENRFSVPAWFAEVVIIAGYLEKKGQISAFAQQVRLVRGHFGTYEPIDFLALLIGYAMSGERTLSDFFERLAPFGPAFMALFGRKSLPHRSSLSRFLADVDRRCVEAFRTLFEQDSEASGWTTETIGGIFDRQGRRSIVFDVDAPPAGCTKACLALQPCPPSS